MVKKRLIVPVETTWQAMYICLRNSTTVFAVENPLYKRMRCFGKLGEVFLPYSVVQHPEKQVAIFVKCRGKNTFDDAAAEFVYLPLYWRSWSS